MKIVLEQTHALSFKMKKIKKYIMKNSKIKNRKKRFSFLCLVAGITCSHLDDVVDKLVSHLW